MVTPNKPEWTKTTTRTVELTSKLTTVELTTVALTSTVADKSFF